MSAVDIRPATIADGAWLAECLDPADRAEIEGAGVDPAAAITAGIARSFEAWTATDDGRIVAIWGIGAADTLGSIGLPWMLTSSLVLNMPHKVARTARAWLRRQLDIWPVLTGNVDIRHGRALRWLAWNGFTLGAAAPFGRHGLPYRPYRLERLAPGVTVDGH